jgi:hypothetical protein
MTLEHDDRVQSGCISLQKILFDGRRRRRGEHDIAHRPPAKPNFHFGRSLSSSCRITTQESLVDRMAARVTHRSVANATPLELLAKTRLEENHGDGAAGVASGEADQQQHAPSRMHHLRKDEGRSSARVTRKRRRRAAAAAAAAVCVSPSGLVALCFSAALVLSGRCFYYGSFRMASPSSLRSTTPSAPDVNDAEGRKGTAAALQHMTDDALWNMGDALSYDDEERMMTDHQAPVKSSSWPADRPDRQQSCAGNYRGVLLIRQTDQRGGAGTALLQLVIGQLLYAHELHLAPWIHLDNSSLVVYDPVIHRATASDAPIRRRRQHQHESGEAATTHVRVVTNVTWIKRPAQYRHFREAVPGPPLLDRGGMEEYETTLEELVASTGSDGIWEHYFEPVNPHRGGCASTGSASSASVGRAGFPLPHVTLPLYLITPGLHGYSTTYATQAWRYDYLPSYVTQPHLPLQQWLEPRRVRAHAAIQQYVRFRPHLRELARRVNPDCRLNSESSCLGLHIRHSDKAAGRRIVPVREFLPYAEAFVRSGGRSVYVATDSTLVWDEIQRDWPISITKRLRALHLTSTSPAASASKKHPNHKIHRSSDQRAVFDLEDAPSDSKSGGHRHHHHHDTNQQALVEILALSNCQFLVHGLSAMSEAAMWINLDLHNASVNLEANRDEDEPVRWTPAMFGSLVRKALAKEPPASWPNPAKQLKDWWNDELTKDMSASDGEALVIGSSRISSPLAALDDPCRQYEGLLHIRSVGKGSTTAAAFFIDVANQLLYAERHRLLPIVHLDPNEAELIYDPSLPHRNQSTVVTQFLLGHDRAAMHAPLVRSTNDGTQDEETPLLLPGKSQLLEGIQWNSSSFVAHRSGIWDDYFEPLHDISYLSRFESCTALPAMTLSAVHVSSFALHAPWALRAWRYDGVPADLWDDVPSRPGLEITVTERSQSKKAALRRKGHEIVGRYFRFRPYLLRQADRVNPAPTHGANASSCLAVHIRVGPKPGRHRSLVKAGAYLPYLEAFIRGGGNTIYVATDSHRALQYVQTTFPEPVKSRIRSAGRYVVRSRMSTPHMDSLPTHLLENHHRVNAETLVDVLALSKCDMMLHSSSTVSEAAVYLSKWLAHEPDRTVNLEVPEAQRVSPADFEALTRRLLAAGR